MKETFGDRLRKLREEHELKIDEFVSLFKHKFPDVSLDKSMVSKYENNVHTPKKFTIVEAIAEFFGVTISYMMGRSESRYDEDNRSRFKKIPVLGSIAAGLPIMAQQDIVSYEYIPESFSATFCLTVKGDSMIGARIMDGDIVYIRQQPEVENGEIAAVMIDNEETTLKRVYKVNGTVILRSENPNYPDRALSKKDMKDVKILGKAVSFRSEVR